MTLQSARRANATILIDFDDVLTSIAGGGAMLLKILRRSLKCDAAKTAHDSLE